jgi:hypothetical protein
MQTSSITHPAIRAAHLPGPGPSQAAPDSNDDTEKRKAFQSFVGQTLFGQLLQAMRKTVGKPAYFHGGRTEEIFQQQLDQVLAEKIAETSARRVAEPMYELFTMQRR